MLVLEHPSQLKSLNLPHITCSVGVFDGVHLGHQKIIKNIVQAAKENRGTSVIITFDKHPYNVLNPAMHLPLLTSPAHKLSLIDELGIDVCVMMKFDKAISNIPAEIWVKEILWNQIHIDAIYLGEDSFFGKDAKGNIELLIQQGAKLGFKVIKTEILRMEKIPINSTVIRNFIIAGDIKQAEKFLGRAYSVYGIPMKGTGKGKELGFPTINLDTQDQCLPTNGVYAIWARPIPMLGYVNIDKKIPAAANLGIRPTFVNIYKKPILEIHILSDEEILPSGNIEVVFIKKIRDEIKFFTATELADQIEKDIAQVKNLFSTL